MKQYKLVIVVLCVVALLFVLGTVSGFFAGRKASENELTFDSAQKYKKTWVAAIQRFLAPFFSLDDNRIQPLSIGSAGKRAYRLTDDNVHDIAILRKSGAEIETAVVRVKENYAKMFVRSSEISNTATTGASRASVEIATRTAINVPTRIRPGRIPGNISHSVQNVRLSVRYFTDEEENGSLASEQTDEVRLAVLEDGGTLRLQCKGCSQNRPVTVILK